MSTISYPLKSECEMEGESADEPVAGKEKKRIRTCSSTLTTCQSARYQTICRCSDCSCQLESGERVRYRVISHEYDGGPRRRKIERKPKRVDDQSV